MNSMKSLHFQCITLRSQPHSHALQRHPSELVGGRLRCKGVHAQNKALFPTSWDQCVPTTCFWSVLTMCSHHFTFAEFCLCFRVPFACPWKPEGAPSFGTVVMDDDHLPWGRWQCKPGPLQESPVLLTADPPFSPQLRVWKSLLHTLKSLKSKIHSK